MIIVSFSLHMAGASRRSKRYEDGFWEARDIDVYQKEAGKGDIPSARVVGAALSEWRRSTAGKTIDREGTRQRLSSAMDSAIAAETDRLSSRLGFLATVGSVAPFVGLFGTVWGSWTASSTSAPRPIRRWRWSRRAFPRRCSPRPSACSPRSPR
jgi:biopolymer transport protein TolQ